MIEAKRTRAGEHADPLQRKVVKPTRNGLDVGGRKACAVSRRRLPTTACRIIGRRPRWIGKRSTVRHLPAARKSQGRVIGQSPSPEGFGYHSSGRLPRPCRSLPYPRMARRPLSLGPLKKRTGLIGLFGGLNLHTVVSARSRILPCATSSSMKPLCHPPLRRCRGYAPTATHLLD